MGNERSSGGIVYQSPHNLILFRRARNILFFMVSEDVTDK